MSEELRGRAEEWLEGRIADIRRALRMIGPREEDDPIHPSIVENQERLEIYDHLLALLQSGVIDDGKVHDTCRMVESVADVRSLVQEIKSARDPHEEEAAIQHLESLYADSPRENAEPVGERVEMTLYAARCGWCGAYEGIVDPEEPCAKDPATGEYIGPHQFEELEEFAGSLYTSPPGNAEPVGEMKHGPKGLTAYWYNYPGPPPGTKLYTSSPREGRDSEKTGAYYVSGTTSAHACGDTLAEAVDAWSEEHSGYPDGYLGPNGEEGFLVSGCEGCGKPITESEPYFAYDEGIVTCSECGGETPDHKPAQPDAILAGDESNE